MRYKIQSIRATYIFLGLAFILLLGAIFIQNEIDNTRDKIKKINDISNVKHVTKLSNNIEHKIVSVTSNNIYKKLKENKKLRVQLENDLQYFITNKYKDIYLLDKKSIENKDFRVLLDATQNKNDKFLFEEGYRPDNIDKYNKVYKTKKSIHFENKDIKSLWMTSIYPIVVENEVKAILVVDFSIKELNIITSTLYELDDIFEIALSFFIFVFIIIIYFSYIDFKREKLKQNAYTSLELKTQELELETYKVKELNETLEQRVSEEVDKNREKDKTMIHQSRLAQMGEMISMIAHQWRQPLTAISATTIELKMKIEFDDFNLDNVNEQQQCKDEFTKELTSVEQYVQNLTNTIDDFRDFYKPHKNKLKESINTPIKKSLNVVRNSIKSDQITLSENYNSTNIIEIFDNELMQVFLNIFKNAQDNFKTKDTENKTLDISTYDNNSEVIVNIIDNGGGIDADILPNIFDPYFSTKHEKNGTGLGLYMSKIIVEEHHNGKLEVKNIKNGVCFKIILQHINQ